MGESKKNRLPYRSFFILGNTPILSSAEIAAVFSRRGIAVQWLSISEEVAIVEITAVIDVSSLMAALGGSIKIGQILPDDMIVEQWVRGRKMEGRIVVGVSVYKAATGVANAQCDDALHAVRGEVLAMKRALKEEGRSLRLVTGRERELPSVALVTEHMLERGGELVVLLSHQGTQFGETLAVQAFHEYRHRDMGRPGRDARRGMLPPKVARMMVNLARVPDGGILLDPFCGSGTVLSEAALLGYQVVGSDISEEAVEDTRKNLDWFQKTYNLQLTTYNFFVSDVRFIADHLEKQSVDAIVTEPYLGPPLTGRETPQQLAKIRHDVSMLVAGAFAAFGDVLRQGARVVIVLPVLGGVLLPIDGIEKLGWQLVSVVPDIAQHLSGITARGTILYGRDDQHLAREITVWTL